MKVEFELLEKKFVDDKGNEIKYNVLSRKLIDGSTIEISIKGDKFKLLMMSLAVERNNKQ